MPGSTCRERPPIDPESDPFAEGHEDQTPPEVYALRDGSARDSPGWRVRVVPNLYPALEPGEPDPVADPLGGGRGEPELFASRPARGAHELIVNSPRPVWSLAELEAEEVETAMFAWRERMWEHQQASYVHVIVNEGREAGASLPHTHAQLYALPFVPAAVARERERFTAYSDRTQGRNLLADLLQEEVRRGERIVAIDDEAVVLCPFAARVPFHFQVVPRRPAPRFHEDGALGARVLHEGAAAPGLRARRAASAEPLGAHRAPRRRALLLADRRDAAPGAPGRSRAGRRGAPERARARGCGRAPAPGERVASRARAAQ